MSNQKRVPFPAIRWHECRIAVVVPLVVIFLVLIAGLGWFVFSGERHFCFFKSGGAKITITEASVSENGHISIGYRAEYIGPYDTSLFSVSGNNMWFNSQALDNYRRHGYPYRRVWRGNRIGFAVIPNSVHFFFEVGDEFFLPSGEQKLLFQYIPDRRAVRQEYLENDGGITSFFIKVSDPIPPVNR